MRIRQLVCALLLSAVPVFGADEVLIVADEFPAMELLARQCESQEDIRSTIVAQNALPADLQPYSAVVVYIHGRLEEGTERALIDYTLGGGRLVALHHSISSGKRKNAHWFGFLGISLPAGEVSEGGYQWKEPVTLQFVNLAPDHFVTTHRISWPGTTLYRAEGDDGSRVVPAFRLEESEVYINHTLAAPRTILLGFKYVDEASGTIHMQDRSGWFKPAGQGLIFYFQPGHSAKDFENPVFSRMIINAIVYQP
jgi:hypothetical protein